MSINRKKIFIISYCIYFLGMVVAQTSVPFADMIKKIGVIISLIGFLLSIFSNGKGILRVRRQGFILLLLMIVALIISIASKDYLIFMIIVMGISAPIYDEKGINSIFRLSILIMMAVSMCAIGAAMLGIIPNVNSPRGWNDPPRFAWGFYHSQIFSFLIFYSLMYYYIIQKKIGMKSIIFGLLFMGIVSKVFDTRNSLYALIIFYVLCSIFYVFKYVNRTNLAKLFIVNAKICPIIMVCLTFVLERLYSQGSKMAVQINSLLSNRLMATHWNLEAVSIKLFRAVSYDEYASMLHTTVDNGYLYILLRYGFIYLVIYMLMFWMIVHFFKDSNNVIGCIALFAISISIYVSNSITNCYFTPFWFVSMNMIKQKIWKPMRGIVKKNDLSTESNKYSCSCV